MKRIGITQRVDYVENYNERRDCLDQCWYSFILELGYIPQPLPNILPTKINQLINALDYDAIIFSGGNSLSSLNPQSDDAAPERDELEFALLNNAIQRNIPVIGVCRGMQMINMHLGGSLEKICGHSGIRHSLINVSHKQNIPDTVNSYHNWAITKDGLAKELSAVAIDEDGNIEAFEQKGKKLLGIMWHPEREKPFKSMDINLIKDFLS